MKLFATLLLASTFVTAFGQGLINRRAPSFSLPDSNYTQFDILDYRGKWLLISFVMTSEKDCPMCKDVVKKLDALQAKNASKLNVLAIVQTPQDNQDTVRKFIAETKTKIPVIFDYSLVGIAYFKATPAKPAMDLPHIFAVDPSGTIVRDWTLSLILGSGFSADVDKLVAGTGASEPVKADTSPKAAPKAKASKK